MKQTTGTASGGMLIERKVLSESQKKALRAYVLKKKRREQEEKSGGSIDEAHISSSDKSQDGSKSTLDEEKTADHTTSTSSTDSVKTADSAPHPDNSHNASSTATKGKEDTLEDVTEQLKSLREKLESLKKEKHQLFQELKKVIHEEDEKKQQQQLQQQQQQHQRQLEQQKMFQSEQDSIISSSYLPTVASAIAGEGSSVSYRGDPRLGKVGMKHQAFPSSYGGGEGPPPGKLPRTMTLQEMPHGYSSHHQHQQPSHYSGISEQDKYGTPPYMQQQRIPPQSHPIRPHSTLGGGGGGTGYHQYRGGHYGGYNPPSGQYVSQPPYQGVPHPPPGGYTVHSPGPLPPPDMMSSQQMYHPPPHQQQYMSGQGIPSHFTFESSHQPSRFTMRGRPPSMKMSAHFSPQRGTAADQGSPAQSPLPTSERIRYVQQQRTKK